MNKDVLDYIYKHEHIYRLLREDSSYYKELFENSNFIYDLDKIAKEKYHLRYVDKLDKISNKFNIITTLLDVFK